MQRRKMKKKRKKRKRRKRRKTRKRIGRRKLMMREQRDDPLEETATVKAVLREPSPKCVMDSL